MIVVIKRKSGIIDALRGIKWFSHYRMRSGKHLLLKLSRTWAFHFRRYGVIKIHAVELLHSL